MVARKRAASSSTSKRDVKSASKRATNSPAASASAGDVSEGNSIPSAKVNDEDDELSLAQLAPAILVSTLVSVGSYISCHSVDMAEDVLVATIRTFFQLSLLAGVLSPLFRLVDYRTTLLSSGPGSFWKRITAPLPVLVYVFCFMLPLASYEASSRAKLTLRPTTSNDVPPSNVIIYIVMFSLFVAISTMGAVAIFVIIKPTPRFSPRQVIPICGMLFNNALTGLSLALDTLLTELQSKRETMELMISFGADVYTATRPTFRSVLASSMKPQINSMNVIGLVAIPGMMTGTLLAGASPAKAARYQIMIMCLILGGVFISVGITTELVITNAFGEKGALRDDWITDNNSLRVSQLVSSLSLLLKPMADKNSKSEINGDIRSPLQKLDENEEIIQRVAVELSTETKGHTADGSFPHFQANLHGTFANGKRIMKANFDIGVGDIAILTGASGVGKSTFLKTVAELNSGFIPSSTSRVAMSINGRDRSSFIPTEWRRHVLYLPQDGATAIQGTPQSFLTFISSIQHSHAKALALESLESQATSHMEAWGITSPSAKLSQPWSNLSGGEAQRILLAIALSTQPKLLLLDEATSALDFDTKLKVEETLKMIAKTGCSIVIVTHDEGQMQRIGTMAMSLVEESS